MRQGDNISKDVLLKLTPCMHRVIIPLYIPEETEYYKDSFDVFSMCLESLHKTSYTKLKISVVSNGCSAGINSKLLELQQQGLIDELIIEREAIGKINSLLKVLRTVEEPFITITDGDVLFLNGWEDKVFEVFEAFPKAGMVSPVPVFRTHFRLTSNIWVRYLFNKRLYFREVNNQNALTKFANSICWSRLDEKWKDTILTLQGKQDVTAVVGCSHFVGTYKRDIFKYLPKVNSNYKLGGNSEFLYTDKPVIDAGGYRLATYDNYAYHMGNTIESWMLETYNALDIIEHKMPLKNNNDFLLKDNLIMKLARFLFEKLLYFKPFKRYLLKKKGLTTKQIENFIS